MRRARALPLLERGVLSPMSTDWVVIYLPDCSSSLLLRGPNALGCCATGRRGLFENFGEHVGGGDVGAMTGVDLKSSPTLVAAGPIEELAEDIANPCALTVDVAAR